MVNVQLASSELLQPLDRPPAQSPPPLPPLFPCPPPGNGSPRLTPCPAQTYTSSLPLPTSSKGLQ